MGGSMFDLTGKTAVVTGATRGIGRALAVGLAEAGADLALLQRDPADSGTKEIVEGLGRKCVIVPCDLADREQVLQAIPEVLSRCGKVDILVNNGGIQRRSPAVDFAESDWEEVMQVNLKSVWLLCQAAGRHMLERRQGKIINIASLVSFQGGITVPAYAAAKGGVGQLTKALANEWAKLGVNVNAIVPGYFATDMNEALLNNQERNEQISVRIPAGRWGAPEDMKGTVVYLASAASDYVHGHLLAVDGGWLGR